MPGARLPTPALLVGVAGLAIVLAALFSMYISVSGKDKNKRMRATNYRLNTRC